MKKEIENCSQVENNQKEIGTNTVTEIGTETNTNSEYITNIQSTDIPSEASEDMQRKYAGNFQVSYPANYKEDYEDFDDEFEEDIDNIIEDVIEHIINNETDNEFFTPFDLEPEYPDTITTKRHAGNIQTKPINRTNSIHESYDSDDYFSLENIVRRHPGQIGTIMELNEEFDGEIIEDILFQLDKD